MARVRNERSLAILALVFLLHWLLVMGGGDKSSLLPSPGANITEACDAVRDSDLSLYSLFHLPSPTELSQCDEIIGAFREQGGDAVAAQDAFVGCYNRLVLCREGAAPGSCGSIFTSCPLSYVHCIQRRVQLVSRHHRQFCSYEARVHLELIAALSNSHGILSLGCVAAGCMDAAALVASGAAGEGCRWPDTVEMLDNCLTIALVTNTETQEITISASVSLDYNSTTTTVSLEPTATHTTTPTFQPPTRAPRTPVPQTPAPQATPAPEPVSLSATHTATHHSLSAPTPVSPSISAITRTRSETQSVSSQTSSLSIGTTPTDSSSHSRTPTASLLLTYLRLDPSSVSSEELAAAELEIDIFLAGDALLLPLPFHSPAPSGASTARRHSATAGTTEASAGGIHDHCVSATVLRRAKSGIGWLRCAPVLRITNASENALTLTISRCNNYAPAQDEEVRIQLSEHCIRTGRAPSGHLTLRRVEVVHMLDSGSFIAASAIGSATAVVAAIAAPTGGAPHALLAQRTQSLVSLAECRYDFQMEFPLWVHPTQARIGGDPLAAVAFGGAIYNTVILLLLHVAHFSVALAIALAARGGGGPWSSASATTRGDDAARAPETWSRAWSRWAKRSRFPHVTVVIFSLLFQPSLSLAAFAINVADRQSIAIRVFSSVTIVLWLGMAAFFIFEVTWRFRAAWEEFNPASQSVFARYFCGLGEWADAPVAAHGYVRRFGALFDAFRPSMVWVSVLELALSTAMGLLQGFRAHDGNCKLPATLAALMFVLYFILVVAARPHKSLHIGLIHVLAAAAQAIISIGVALIHYGIISKGRTIVAIPVVVLSALFVIRFAVDVAWLLTHHHLKVCGGEKLSRKRLTSLSPRRLTSALPSVGSRAPVSSSAVIHQDSTVNVEMQPAVGQMSSKHKREDVAYSSSTTSDPDAQASEDSDHFTELVRLSRLDPGAQERTLSNGNSSSVQAPVAQRPDTFDENEDFDGIVRSRWAKREASLLRQRSSSRSVTSSDVAQPSPLRIRGMAPLPLAPDDPGVGSSQQQKLRTGPEWQQTDKVVVASRSPSYQNTEQYRTHDRNRERSLEVDRILSSLWDDDSGPHMGASHQEPHDTSPTRSSSSTLSSSTLSLERSRARSSASIGRPPLPPQREVRTSLTDIVGESSSLKLMLHEQWQDNEKGSQHPSGPLASRLTSHGGFFDTIFDFAPPDDVAVVPITTRQLTQHEDGQENCSSSLESSSLSSNDSVI